MKESNESYLRLFDTAWANLLLVKKESTIFHNTPITINTSTIKLIQP
ncbi:MAG: hypothetical protein ACK5PC_07965 [Cyclobacteriaceae bacterium]|jgi:hypothetical protein